MFKGRNNRYTENKSLTWNRTRVILMFKEIQVLKETLVNATVILKTGHKLKTQYKADHEFSPDSFTAGTIHAVRVDGKSVFFQGDNVSLVIVEPSGVQA